MRQLVEMDALQHEEKTRFRHMSWESLDDLCKTLRLRWRFSIEAVRDVQVMFAEDIKEEMLRNIPAAFLPIDASSQISNLVRYAIIEQHHIDNTRKYNAR